MPERAAPHVPLAPTRGSSTVPRRFDAIVMAGDRGAARPVKGINKVLLEIQGVPLLFYVVSALERSRYVSRIFIVGPKQKIEEAIRTRPSSFQWHKPVFVLEQWNSLLENAWNTFLATLDGEVDDRPFREDGLRSRYGDRVALVVGADIPLVTPYEVDEFVEGCNLEEYDLIVGMTSEEVLKAYYPHGERPGIRLAYFVFKDSLERQNNLHMIRFFRIINKEYAEKMYRYRYQRNWRNIVRLGLEILRMPEMTSAILFRFFLLHCARVLDGIGLHWICRVVSRFLEKATLEKDIARLLKVRFASVVTHYGGAALDVDNEEHFRAMEANFERWKRLQEELSLVRVKGDPRA